MNAVGGRRSGILIVFLLLVGEVLLGASISRFAELSSSAALVTIDGRSTIKQEILDSAGMWLALSMNKHGRTKITPADKRQFEVTCRQGTRMAVQRAVVARYAAEAGLTNDVQTLQGVVREFETSQRRYSKSLGRWQTLADIKEILGDGGARYLDREIAARATFHTVTNHILRQAKVSASEVMVSNRLDILSRYNARVAMTNELVFAHATNVWKRILSQELTFAQAVARYTEECDAVEGGAWGTFGLDQLADEPEVLKLLPSLDKGSISPPVRSDGGLAILRLDDKENWQRLSFSRIYFRLPMAVEMESPAQARDFLQHRAESAAVHDALMKVKARMLVEYPHGTNLFSNVGCLL